MLPSQLLPAFQGVAPCVIVTSDKEGVPNIANLSRVWYVDSEHVAIANQLLYKTKLNLQTERAALLKIVNPSDRLHWELTLRFLRSEEEGPLFALMHQDLQAVQLEPAPPRHAELLQALAEFDWERLSCWIPREEGGSVVPQLLASRGVPGAGAHPAALEPMERLAALVMQNRRVIRLHNIRSQLRYVYHLQPGEQVQQQESSGDRVPSLSTSYFAFPLFALGKLVGVVCHEETDPRKNRLEHILDEELLQLSERLGEALASADGIEGHAWGPLFRQVIERSKLEWRKTKEPFHTVLSARERQVAVCVAQGQTNAEIAKALFISLRTVTTHLERIYQKLQLTSRAALTRYIVEKGLQKEAPHIEGS
ncbi:LuxR C-terminal-related transcriptional regulator [Paenibacillus sp. GD4]|uniref:LuxR C-terminal-related transcriptional regulator n=1 Tax=Paenibacillus sp. GD4 TaxID=3068890 RepID=UPI0027964064|nr:LuxR C-terminal-related transcriptional regulator [Paenibacillus sp. GD4]MDQ1910749.1 LuxR C-terminal-related transcriptional regulator [Paenibacillus sp. GD4]